MRQSSTQGGSDFPGFILSGNNNIIIEKNIDIFIAT